MNAVHLKAMLGMQHAMNARVNPAYLVAGYPWLRAVVVEGGEALDHHGWKWWKKQTPDMEQLKIEMIDIWHFYLSQAVQEHDGALSGALSYMLEASNSDYQREGVSFDGVFREYKNMDILQHVELIIGLAVCRRWSVPLFESLMRLVGMTDDDLYRQYVAKNVLNFFRQDHGYKEGTYVKDWAGQEDNVYLAEVMPLIVVDGQYSENLYAALKAKYDRVLIDLNRDA